MRILALLLSLVLMSACATGKPEAEQEFVTRVGVITGKEVVELDQVKSESRVSTGVSISRKSFCSRKLRKLRTTCARKRNCCCICGRRKST